jgi:aminoglycoside phosphotransferase (APT) family kinase protein
MSRSEWLLQRHAAWSTPDEVLDELVRAATGSSTAERTRIIKGEANETYHARDEAGTQLILKVAHQNPQRFADLERNASLLARAGVGVPEVLHRRVIDLPGGPAAAVVQRFIAGTSLEDLLPTLDAAEVGRLVEEAGELLARFHSVRVTDDGPMSAHCVKEMMQDLGHAGDALAAHGIDAASLESLVRAHASVLDQWPLCLTHGDFGPDHVILKDGHVVGVIDLDSARTGVPVVDISWWDTFFDRPPHPSARLITGYERVAPLGDHAVARDVYSLATGVGKLQYFFEHERQDAAGFVATSLRRWTERLAQ